MKEKQAERIASVAMLALLVALIVRNALSLYSTPLPNTWVWWPGDETWLMAQYKNFATTGHYINPMARGSVFAHSMGVLFGSCYVVAILYGGVASIVHASPVDVGRTISWIAGLGVLFGLYRALRSYEVRPAVAVFGCLILASTIAYFLTSHSAKYDVWVGGCSLLLIAIASRGDVFSAQNGWLIGAIYASTLLLTAHIFIQLFPVLIFLIIRSPRGYRGTLAIKILLGTVSVIAVLTLIQYSALGDWSFFGLLRSTSNDAPLKHILNPGTHIALAGSYWFFFSDWAPATIVLGVVAITGAILLRKQVRWNSEITHVAGACLVFLIAGVYLQPKLPRYMMHRLPVLVFVSVLILERMLRENRLHRSLAIFGAACALATCYLSVSSASQIAKVGSILAQNNRRVVSDIAHAIAQDSQGESVLTVTSVPAQYIMEQQPGVKMQTLLFLYAPDTTGTIVERCKQLGVRYVVTTSTSRAAQDPAEARLDSAIAPYATLLLAGSGVFTDVGRYYGLSALSGLDTIKLYRCRWQ